MKKPFYLYFSLLICTASKLHSSQEIYKNCAQCEKENCTSRCGKCHEAYYCSKKCQVKHWKSTHKKYCQKPISEEMFDKFKKCAMSNRIRNAGLYSSLVENPNRTNPSIRKQIDAILPKGLAINSTDRRGDTVLHIATFLGSYECVKCLLERPVDINQKNKEGYVPFANTCISEDLLSADLLLSRPEIDFNIKGRYNSTILGIFSRSFKPVDKDNDKRYGKWEKAKIFQILLKLLKRSHYCISEISCLQNCLKILIDVSDNQGMGEKDFRSAMNLAAMHYIFLTLEQAKPLPGLSLFKKDYLDFLPNLLNLKNLKLRKLHPQYDDKVFLSITGYIRRPYVSNMNEKIIDDFGLITIQYYLEPTFGTFIKSMAILDDGELLKKDGKGYKPVDYHEKIKEIDLKSSQYQSQTTNTIIKDCESLNMLNEAENDDNSSELSILGDIYDSDKDFDYDLQLLSTVSSSKPIQETDSQKVSLALLDSDVLYPPISACISFIASQVV